MSRSNTFILSIMIVSAIIKLYDEVVTVGDLVAIEVASPSLCLCAINRRFRFRPSSALLSSSNNVLPKTRFPSGFSCRGTGIRVPCLRVCLAFFSGVNELLFAILPCERSGSLLILD